MGVDDILPWRAGPRQRFTDDHGEAIEDLFPKPARTRRSPRDPRVMMDALLWILRTGSPWRDLPEEYGPWKTVWHHFNKWNASGSLGEIRDRLRASHVDAGAIDDELWCEDGTVVRVDVLPTVEKGGIPTSRRTMHWAAREVVFSTKVYLLCDRRAPRSTSTSRRGKRTRRKP